MDLLVLAGFVAFALICAVMVMFYAMNKEKWGKWFGDE